MKHINTLLVGSFIVVVLLCHMSHVIREKSYYRYRTEVGALEEPKEMSQKKVDLHIVYR